MEATDITTINDEIARKFRKIEAGLSARQTPAELFEALFVELEMEFGIPFVWLSLIRLPETSGLRKSLEASAFLRDRMNSIDKASFLEIVPDFVAPLLVSGDLKPFFRLLPRTRKYLIRSIAVSPITLRGTPIGSINHGDASPARYEPGMDTTLLRHLARSVSENLARIFPPGERQGSGRLF